ncbi:Protein FAM32A [Chionoecetes opilio]|uniref:Protein FAM32A n=1 Tax=Chionoecetes opilio TaxID=41210 RepID=A0A8J5CVQ8_CHIOP|nr:Protein FAM32A [Chionoecetes opilio]
MAGDEYFASKSSLKLKGVAETGIKKKKKKKAKDQEMGGSTRRNTALGSTPEKEAPSASMFRNYTEAERRFMERQRKMEADRILKKASKTHKEKVEDFNRHLDSLTEHFDIPKVSWTK